MKKQSLFAHIWVVEDEWSEGIYYNDSMAASWIIMWFSKIWIMNMNLISYPIRLFSFFPFLTPHHIILCISFGSQYTWFQNAVCSVGLITPISLQWRLKTLLCLRKRRKIVSCPYLLAKSYIKNNNSHHPVLKYVIHIFNSQVEITWICIRNNKTKGKNYNNFQ